MKRTEFISIIIVFTGILILMILLTIDSDHKTKENQKFCRDQGGMYILNGKRHTDDQCIINNEINFINYLKNTRDSVKTD